MRSRELDGRAPPDGATPLDGVALLDGGVRSSRLERLDVYAILVAADHIYLEWSKRRADARRPCVVKRESRQLREDVDSAWWDTDLADHAWDTQVCS